MNRWASWAIRITHLPTGTVVETDEMGCATRSMWRAKQRLMEQLRAKLAAGPQPSALVREYDLIADTVTDNLGTRTGAQRVLDGTIR